MAGKRQRIILTSKDSRVGLKLYKDERAPRIKTEMHSRFQVELFQMCRWASYSQFTQCELNNKIKGFGENVRPMLGPAKQ